MGYCHDIQAKAQDELEVLKARKVDIDAKMHTRSKKDEEQRLKQLEDAKKGDGEQDKHEETEAIRAELEEKAKSLELGQNLEQNFSQLSKYNKPVPKPKKEAKEKPAPR